MLITVTYSLSDAGQSCSALFTDVNWLPPLTGVAEREYEEVLSLQRFEFIASLYNAETINVKVFLLYNILIKSDVNVFLQESGAVAMPQLLFFGLKFADNKFKSSQASKARLQNSKRTGAKRNLTQNGHSRSRVLDSVKGDKGLSNTKY